jgi:hypothetical protein
VTPEEFTASVSAAAPPHGLDEPLVALWHDGRGDWKTAHEVAQNIHDETGAWIHAYLHRKEGDAGNAAYWYRIARRPVATGPLAEEFTMLVTTLLSSRP